MVDIAEWLRAIRKKNLFRKKHWKPQKYYCEMIFGKKGKIFVLSGPFQGMRYFNKTVWGPLMPKWLGSYEDELHGIVEEICRAHYDVIIDVGCAEGYYAVGFARTNPQAKIYAYDIDPFARKQCMELKKANDLGGRLIILSCCSCSEITRRVEGRTLVFCDIEGFECELLDPHKCPSLGKVDILVEIHSFNGMGEATVCGKINKRFEKTHQIQQISSHEKDLSKYKNLANLSDGELAECLNEWRPSGQRWLWMRAKKEV